LFGNLKYAILESLQKKNIAVSKALPPYVQSEDGEIIEQVKPYSMQTRIRIYSLLRAVEYVIEQKIPGDFVEFGVWRGGDNGDSFEARENGNKRSVLATV
jgi:hypothetical protein